MKLYIQLMLLIICSLTGAGYMYGQEKVAYTNSESTKKEIKIIDRIEEVIRFAYNAKEGTFIDVIRKNTNEELVSEIVSILRSHHKKPNDVLTLSKFVRAFYNNGEKLTACNIAKIDIERLFKKSNYKVITQFIRYFYNLNELELAEEIANEVIDYLIAEGKFIFSVNHIKYIYNSIDKEIGLKLANGYIDVFVKDDSQTCIELLVKYFYQHGEKDTVRNLVKKETETLDPDTISKYVRYFYEKDEIELALEITKENLNFLLKKEQHKYIGLHIEYLYNNLDIDFTTTLTKRFVDPITHPQHLRVIRDLIHFFRDKSKDLTLFLNLKHDQIFIKILSETKTFNIENKSNPSLTEYQARRQESDYEKIIQANAYGEASRIKSILTTTTLILTGALYFIPNARENLIRFSHEALSRGLERLRLERLPDIID